MHKSVVPSFIPKDILTRQGAYLPCRGYARLHPRFKDQLSILDSGSGISAIDEKRRAVTFIISTIERDRVGDEVVPEGCQLDNYRKNAIWFFGHQVFPLPIGTADDGGRAPLGITIEPGKRILGTCYFHEETLEAEQVFRLVVKRILRAVSIGFNPTEEPEKLGEVPGNLFAGYRFPKWELLEVSVCGVGMHPGAVLAGSDGSSLDQEYRELVRAELSRNRIEGKPIAEPIRKSLEALAAPAPALVTSGFDLSLPDAIAQAVAEVVEQHQRKNHEAQMAKVVKPTTKPTTRTTKATPAARPQGKCAGCAGKPAKNAPAKPAKPQRKAPMSETSGTAGGNAVPDHDHIKACIKDVAVTHQESAPEGGPHDFYYHPEKAEVWHHHDEDAAPDHLEAVKADLEGISGITSVVQSPEPPKDDGHELVHKFDNTSSANMVGASMPAALIQAKVAAGRVIRKMARYLPKAQKDALQDCVGRKVPILLSEGHEQDQAEAIAYSMCGEGKDIDMDSAHDDEPPGTETKDDEMPDDDGGDNPMGSGNPGHGAECARQIVTDLTDLIPQMEPEVAEFFQQKLEEIREWAQERYPDEDFGEPEATDLESEPDEGDEEGDGSEEDEASDEGADGAQGEAADEEDTEEALDKYQPYRSANGKHKAAKARRVAKKHLERINEAAQHLLDISSLPDDGFGKLHRTASKYHANELLGVHRGLAGDGAVPTGETVSVGDGAASTGDSVQVGDGAAKVTGKSALEQELEGYRASRKALADAFYGLTGKRLGNG